MGYQKTAYSRSGSSAEDYLSHILVDRLMNSLTSESIREHEIVNFINTEELKSLLKDEVDKETKLELSRLRDKVKNQEQEFSDQKIELEKNTEKSIRKCLKDSQELQDLFRQDFDKLLKENESLKSGVEYKTEIQKLNEEILELKEQLEKKQRPNFWKGILR